MCLYPASLDEISLSYNGGKDCLVLLILLLCALATYKKDALPKQLHSVYIISPHPFKEVDAFVDESVATYNLDLARYAMPMKEAFKLYLEEHKKVKAILVGTRRTDPHGQSLTHFDMTDSGWPAFMRVHPVIDWHYAEIWAVSLKSLEPVRRLLMRIVYTTFRDSLLSAVRSGIYITWWHNRYVSKPCFESGRRTG
jgi:3'-phosphoadenosine 5'-phosphosulfate sulfotransferase (PAPS reductase)/FAD synthetase